MDLCLVVALFSGSQTADLEDEPGALTLLRASAFFSALTSFALALWNALAFILALRQDSDGVHFLFLEDSLKDFLDDSLPPFSLSLASPWMASPLSLHKGGAMYVHLQAAGEAHTSLSADKVEADKLDNVDKERPRADERSRPQPCLWTLSVATLSSLELAMPLVDALCFFEAMEVIESIHL